MSSEGDNPVGHEHSGDNVIEMPAPTVWPMVISFGVALIGAGFITNWMVSVFGAIITFVAVRGWIRDLLPQRGEMAEPRVPPDQRPAPVFGEKGRVEFMREGLAGYRFRLPEKIHPYSAGAKGGLIGGAAMIVPALLFGLISGKHVWYPINLLSAMVITIPDNELESFSFAATALGAVIHAVTSVAVGLMYAVVLPTLPRRHPIFWGGIVLPLMWTGALYSFMGVLNPHIAERVFGEISTWPWFVLSQFVFGLVCGIVVIREEEKWTHPEAAEHAQRTAGTPPSESSEQEAPPREEEGQS